MAENCTHLDQIKRVKPKTKGCEECLKMGEQLGASSPMFELRPCRLL